MLVGMTVVAPEPVASGGGARDGKWPRKNDNGGA